MGQVLRVAKVSGDDIRLNMKLYKACATDWKKFCKDVEPGHMRVQVRGFGCVSV
jgi:Golgi apparatus protein 1